ncbi:ead/Ea22-like family protein [Klebsiella variicola]|uniref:ead/Ea22-like family protein n=1 Tax=Klebsiella variicola TaxID=244366 RepID=UPI000E2C1A75|nr:ead/Ea22-like family protein [Klebsiella variicola]SXE31849.1 Uncharacterised protein [Klebsiella variicola]
MKVKTYSVNTFDAWLQTEGDDTTGSYVKYEDYAALAAECAALKSAIEFAEPWLPTCDEELLHRIEIAKQTPATDRIVAWIKAEGRVEGAHFVANRMLAAWDAGFIEDTAKNAADIARMILASTEFMAGAPEGDFDRSFADGILEDIAQQLREGAK